MTKRAILEIKKLSKIFGGIRAVDSITLDVIDGTIHAIVGPNGAGKTTFFNLLTGFYKPTAGEIQYSGLDITSRPPEWLAARGITRSFQMSSVLDPLTVRQNIILSLPGARRYSYCFWRSQKILGQYNAEAEQILDRLNLLSEANTVAAYLPYGRKRALELGTALATKPKILLLDEPTQGMSHEDIEYITNLIGEIGRTCTVVMIEHNMSIIKKISDVVTVLQSGSILAHGVYDDVARNRQVREAYLGSDVFSNRSSGNKSRPERFYT